MVAKVVGYERVDFSDNNGNSIKGTRLYITYQNEGINGQGSDMKFFSDDAKVKLPEIVIGREYDFNYQMKGFTGKPTLVSVTPYKQ